jgi:hypothetical protein
MANDVSIEDALMSKTLLPVLSDQRAVARLVKYNAENIRARSATCEI